LSLIAIWAIITVGVWCHLVKTIQSQDLYLEISDYYASSGYWCVISAAPVLLQLFLQQQQYKEQQYFTAAVAYTNMTL
jgi:hypothetical protein